VIIKICDLNKMYGSETDYLSSYLDSLKKMINCEDSKIKQTKASICQRIEEAKNSIKDLRNRKKELIHQQEVPVIPYTSIATDSTNQRATYMGMHQIEE
jgi:hypothetical protein